MTSDFPDSPRSDTPNRDRATWQTAIVCGGVIVVGAIAAVGLSRRLEITELTTEVPLTSTESTESAESTTPAEPADLTLTQEDGGAIAEEARIVTYWLQDSGSGFTLMPISETVTPDEAVSAAVAPNSEVLAVYIALDHLLSQSDPGDVIQAIPAGVTVNQVERHSDGLNIDLSAEFTSGGGSASMQGRLAQVVYTVTNDDPEEAVWLSIEGEPLTLLGGEGLEVPYPITRESFEANFSL